MHFGGGAFGQGGSPRTTNLKRSHEFLWAALVPMCHVALAVRTLPISNHNAVHEPARRRVRVHFPSGRPRVQMDRLRSIDMPKT